MAICTVCGSSKQVRKGLCGTHYFRMRRTGSVGTAEIAHKAPAGTECSVDDCTDDILGGGKGMCVKHYIRVHRHGDPTIVLSSGLPAERNPNWAGEDVGYSGLHMRIRRARGNADQQMCKCGSRANEWAYDYSDPNERIDEASGSPYSIDVNRYVAMCYGCHRRHDHAHR